MNIYWLSLKEGTPAKHYWDQYLLEQMFKHENHVESLEGIREATVIIPGAYQFDLVNEINKELSTLEKVTVIITSDEENKFPLDKLAHPNMRLYGTYPHETSVKVTWLPIGPPPQIVKASKELPVKTSNVYFSGQVNHESRVNMIEQIKDMDHADIVTTPGFAQGLDHVEYYKRMAKAKVVAAPRGNISPDSFRLYEALELGCVPIVENSAFWDKMTLGHNPFPTIDNPEQWPGYITDAVNQYPKLNNRVQATWLNLKYYLREELNPQEKQVTAVMPLSPIASNPDIAIFKETFDSIRFHFPDAPVILTFDGIREEQKEKTDNYNEYIRRVLWSVKDDTNVRPYIYDEHLHQVGMMKDVLPYVTTPLLLYMEQDCPLVVDYDIPFDKLANAITSGESNLIRFHFEAFIPEPHKHLMIGEPENDLLKTAQWSQRPHLASTAFYKRIIEDNFSKDARCFIEDRIHGKVIEDFKSYGMNGWNQWRLHIYHPEGNIKRSYTLDGRAGAAKYDTLQVW